MADDTPFPSNLDANSDDVVLSKLAALIPADAHPATLNKALASYRELETRTLPEIAVLFAYQQIIIEGLGAATEAKNTIDESKLGLNKVSNGGIVMPQRIKKRY